MDGNGADESLGGQLLDGLTRQRAVNLKTISNNGRGDDLVRGELLHELVVGLLVEDDLVLQLLLRASLRPLHTQRFRFISPSPLYALVYLFFQTQNMASQHPFKASRATFSLSKRTFFLSFPAPALAALALVALVAVFLTAFGGYSFQAQGSPNNNDKAWLEPNFKNHLQIFILPGRRRIVSNAFLSTLSVYNRYYANAGTRALPIAIDGNHLAKSHFDNILHFPGATAR